MWAHETLKVDTHEARLLATALLLQKLAEDGKLTFRDENDAEYEFVVSGYGSSLGVGIRRLPEVTQDK